MKPYRITDLLAEYQYGNKSTVVNVVEGDSYTLVPKLRSEVIDFAFIRDRDDSDNEFSKTLFAVDSLCVVVPADHKLARRDCVEISQLEGESLLLIGKDAFMYKLCIELCKNAGFYPRVTFTSHRAENLSHLVSRGMGITMLMKTPAATLISDRVKLIDVTPTFKTRIYPAWLPNRKMGLHAKKFLELARKLDDKCDHHGL